MVDVPDDLVVEYQRAKAAEKEISDRVEEAQQRLLHSIGVNEAGRFSGGVVTYLEQTRKSYQVAESTFRTIRVKTDKKALVTT